MTTSKSFTPVTIGPLNVCATAPFAPLRMKACVRDIDLQKCCFNTIAR